MVPGTLRQQRGAGLVEVLVAVAVVALLAAAIYPLQLLAVRTQHAVGAEQDLRRALERFRGWLEGDARAACGASIRGDVLELTVFVGGQARRVRYLPEASTWIRVVTTAGGGQEQELRRDAVARGVQAAWLGYDHGSGLLQYRLEAPGAEGVRTFRHDGAVWLRAHGRGC